jgi:hypothetical protein
MLCDRSGARLPDFIIVGAAKAGTTSLYYYLADHPEVGVTSFQESHYFAMKAVPSPAGHGPHAIGHVLENYADYLNQFADVPADRVCGEKSVTYLYKYAETIERIQETYVEPRKVKIIILTRDPVERAFSDYSMHLRNGGETLSFDQACEDQIIQDRLAQGYNFMWDYVGLGYYSAAIDAFAKAFDDVLLLDFKWLSDEPEALMQVVCKFLEIGPADPGSTQKVYNRGGAPKAGLGGTLVKLAFRDNPLRRIAAKILPKALKRNLKQAVAANFTEKSEAPTEMVAKLSKLYATDAEKVASLYRSRPFRHFSATK